MSFSETKYCETKEECCRHAGVKLRQCDEDDEDDFGYNEATFCVECDKICFSYIQDWSRETSKEELDAFKALHDARVKKYSDYLELQALKTSATLCYKPKNKDGVFLGTT